VLVNIVTECFGKYFENFDTSIETFVSTSNAPLKLFDVSAIKWIADTTLWVFVRSITNCHLPRRHLASQPISFFEDCKVVFRGSKRPTNPDEFALVHVKPDLIIETRAMRLMRKPIGVWISSRLSYATMSTVYRNDADYFVISVRLIDVPSPNNLKVKKND
jgi:hypothetical protein